MKVAEYSGMATTTLEKIIKRSRDISQVDKAIVERVPDNELDLDNPEGRCVEAAVIEFSNDKPRRRVKKVTPNGTDYLFILENYITGWDSSKTLDVIQYALDEPKDHFYDDNHWKKAIDFDTEKEAIRFIYGPPAEPFAIWYFEPHTVDATTCTILTTEQEAVCQKVAEKTLFIGSTRAAVFSEDESMKGDGVDYKSISERYLTLHDKCARKYAELVDKKTPVFSPTFVDMDLDEPQSGPNIFHSPDYY